MHDHRADDAPLADLSGHTEPIPAPNPNSPPPRPLNPEGPVPFLMLRGRWLRQMGFCVGGEVLVEAVANGVITLRMRGVPGERDPKVPGFFFREIHYTEVEEHTHFKRRKGASR